MEVDMILDSIGRCPATGVDEAARQDDDREARDVEMRQILAMYDVAERHAAQERHAQILSVVQSLGSNSRAYHRERAKCA